MMLSKSVHPFLSLANSNDYGTLLDFPLPHHHHHNLCNIFGTASLGGDFDSKKSEPPPNSSASKRDPGGIGFLDEVGGSVDGLMSCTESLGFESSDERTLDEDLHDHDSFSRKSYPNNSWQKSCEKKEEKKFPPPLSSLNHDGKPNFYLRAVRKDGRLELKEVKIGRPETLLASRQDGRLRLHLIRSNDEEEEEEEDFTVKTEEELDDEEEVIEENDEESIDDDEGVKVSEWMFPVTSGGGRDGFRRCYELTCHHHHHGHHHQGHNNHPHVWRQQHCVPTR